MTPNVGDMIESFHKLCDKIETNHVRMSSIQDTCHHIVQNVYQTNEVSILLLLFIFVFSFCLIYN